ncbi:MAG: 30S ribosome-binding factor RbfA [Dehalococcoidia bacterium]
MSRRLERLNVQVRRELAALFLRQLKDPRLAGLITFTHVDIAPDLQTAKVYVSVLGSQEEKASTIEALTAASTYLRRELGERLIIRRVPRLTFILDESMEEAARLLDLIDRVAGDHSGD